MTRLLPDALFLSLTQPDLHPMGPGWDRNEEEVKFHETFLSCLAEKQTQSGLVHREIGPFGQYVLASANLLFCTVTVRPPRNGTAAPRINILYV